MLATCTLITHTLYCDAYFPFFNYRNMTEMMTTVSLQIVGIIEPIIQHADWFFPGGGNNITVNSVHCCNRGYAHVPESIHRLITLKH